MPTYVAVTGASGFLGGHLVLLLAASGERVVGIDRLPRPPHLLGLPGYIHVEGELTAADEHVVTALREADAVMHLAGCPGVRDRAADVDHRRRRDNIHAIAAVFAATPLATPLVVATSSSVYGGSRANRPCREGDPLRPRGGYAASKAMVEQLCAARVAQGGATVAARPFTVAGERQRPDMALSTWIAATRAGEPLRLLGAPTRTRDITDVKDVARVLVALARGGATGPVNVGTGQAHTLTELADAVCAAVGRDVPRVVVPASAEEVSATLADTTRLQRLVGFVPRTDLPRLVARQAAADRPLVAAAS